MSYHQREIPFEEEKLDLLAAPETSDDQSDAPFPVRELILEDLNRKGVNIPNLIDECLPPRHRLVLMLVGELGYSLDQTASILNLKSHKDIVRIINSAKKRLQKEMGVFSYLFHSL